ASADQANPPPRVASEFIGSSSIRFWESLATDFPGQPVFQPRFRRLASADQANPPPRVASEFIGSSSIRFWESLATDF
ncbi:hypothetical protein C7E17_26130, partial [Stenotrophomonas maltophilia]